MPVKKQLDGSPEIKAISVVYEALKGLDSAAQTRVLRYASEMLGLGVEDVTPPSYPKAEDNRPTKDPEPPKTQPSSNETHSLGDLDGVNLVAAKWVARSGLDAKGLQNLFSLGIDDIDLIAKSVPGDSKRERMHNVLLLKGIAAYLSGGTPRITYEQLKEACLHYNAYDAPHFATYLKNFAADVGGTREAGLTLTARGLTSGTDLVKQMLNKS